MDAAVVERLEEGKADDVVEVAVGEEDVEVLHAFLDEQHAEALRARADVEDEDMRAAAHLDAG